MMTYYYSLTKHEHIELEIYLSHYHFVLRLIIYPSILLCPYKIFISYFINSWW